MKVEGWRRNPEVSFEIRKLLSPNRIRLSTFDFRPSTFDLRPWTFDLRLWTLDFGRWTLDFDSQISPIPIDVSRDQPRASLESNVGPGPLKQHDEAVAKPDQEKNVHKKPYQPGNDS